MKIRHVIGTMGSGGAQGLLVDLLPPQRDLGHDVSVLELSGASKSVFRKPLLDAGITIQAVGNSNLYCPLLIFRISKYLKGADVVHVHLFPALYWVALAKTLFGGKYKLIYTEHSTNNKRRSSAFWHIIDKIIYKKYDKIVACSDNAKECFDKAFPDLKCLSIPNGINLKKMRAAIPYGKQELWGINEDTIVSTMVARFEYPKRQEVIVESLKELPGKFHCAFVGGSANAMGVEKVKSFAESEGLANRVHFMYTRSDVPRILKTSDFIILSSDYEGLSLSMIEGMSVGKPFIASDAPGLSDVVSGAGVLFNCGDSHQLACILKELDADKEKYQSVANACNNRANEFDIVNVANKYLKVYQDTLKA